jgi:hypothetical protein
MWGTGLAEATAVAVAPLLPVVVADDGMAQAAFADAGLSTPLLGQTSAAAPAVAVAPQTPAAMAVLSPAVSLLPWLAGAMAVPERLADAPVDLMFAALPGLGASTGPLTVGAAGAVATPGGSVPWPANLSAQLVAGLSSSAEAMTQISLAPEELGKVRLQLQVDAQNPDRMIVALQFERPETLDLFRRHSADLTEALRAAGYSDTRLDFGQSGLGTGADRSGSSRETQAAPPAPREGPWHLHEPDTAASLSSKRAAASGLDIRL